MNDHTNVEKCIAEAKNPEEDQEPADKVMEQMEFIGTKITEVSPLKRGVSKLKVVLFKIIF